LFATRIEKNIHMLYDFITTHLGLMYELSGSFIGLALIVAVAATLISRFDRVPLEDALYLAFITALTVGFGDVSPKSRGARVVCVFLAFVGLILVGILVAIAVHALGIALEGKK
jgi:voltage-gated potassium channel